MSLLLIITQSNTYINLFIYDTILHPLLKRIKEICQPQPLQNQDITPTTRKLAKDGW